MAQWALTNLREQHISKLGGSTDAWIKGRVILTFPATEEYREEKKKKNKNRRSDGDQKTVDMKIVLLFGCVGVI